MTKLVSVAYKNKGTGLVFSAPLPYRHRDLVQHLYSKGLELTTDAQFVPGFVTEDRRFVDQFEAMAMAVLSGQVNPEKVAKSQWNGALFAEHLWPNEGCRHWHNSFDNGDEVSYYKSYSKKRRT